MGYENMRTEYGQWMSADKIGPGDTFIPRVKVTFGPQGSATDISAENPLPVYLISRNLTASTTPPLVGTSSAQNRLAGPFAAPLTRPVMLTLQGNWTGGNVVVLRSVDGGTTKLPLTVAGEPYAQFTGPCQEPVWTETEAGATLYLQFPADGITYRMAS